MKTPKLVLSLLATALVLSSCDVAPDPVGPAQESPSLAVAAPGNVTLAAQHVFVLHGRGKVAEIAPAIEAAGGKIDYEMTEIGVALVSGLSDAAAASIAKGKATVANDVSSQWVPETTLEVEAAEADATATATATPGTASLFRPETAFFYRTGFQWNMSITDTDDAWTRYTGIPSVRVAILDTGLDPYHQDQTGLIDVASSRAFVPSTAGPPTWQDDHYHGTHVGGIVTSNNIGTAGVAPNVTLVAVKVLGVTGSGSFGGIIAGIYYAADVKVDVINMSIGAYFEKSGNTATLVAVKVLGVTGSGSFGGIIAGIYYAADVKVDVINMSLGAYFEKSGNTAKLVSALNRAVNYAHARDVFVVAAAGNSARDLQHNENEIQVPCETGVLSCISATGAQDRPAYYTNFGVSAINNAAPGGDFTQRQPFPTGMVLSLCSTRANGLGVCRARLGEGGLLGRRYIWAQGTSMAAPHIAGLGAYLDSQHGGTLNGSQILTKIQQHADDLGKPGTDEFYGKGRMNTCRTLPGCAPGKGN